MVKRVNLKSPGKCIFCGGGNLTKEHVWSEWTHELIGKTLNVSHYEANYMTNPFVTRLARQMKRHGHTATKKLRVVCGDCNNGWMSGLESMAKTFVTPLILGGQVSLDVEVQNVVATWVALKALIIEHNTRENVVASQQDRDAFRVNKSIPSGMKIAIGRCDKREWNAGPSGRFFRKGGPFRCSAATWPKHSGIR
jgi:hypothetical protein